MNTPVRRVAVVLFNLGGPDSLDAVEPFLFNLFSDPAIMRVPWPIRPWLARLISRQRAPVARGIYEHLGGRSPLLPETEAQAQALSKVLRLGVETEAHVFIAMRYWRPRAAEAVAAIAEVAPDDIVLLPLYPQFSTTTTASSIADFEAALKAHSKSWQVRRICCYPTAPDYVAALADGLRTALADAEKHGPVRVLFSAHGLPERIAKAGDPYTWQIGETVKAVLATPDLPALDSVICYQSRVGPLKWVGPSTDEEIERAAADGRVIVIVPIAFVSEHSETLVELDIEYRKLAEAKGAKGYIRVPTAGTHPIFIQALADLARDALTTDAGRPYCNARLCPAKFTACPNG
jgi:ferrochelatase